MACFNWLHLTDLHLGLSGQMDYWPQVEFQFFKDLDDILTEIKSIDLVLFTGDLTQSGTPKQFNNLEALLKKIWSKFNEKGFKPCLFAIPGNHDLVRPKNLTNPALITLVDNWSSPNVHTPFLNYPNSQQRKLVIRAFANYQNWWGKTSLPKPRDCTNGLLPGDCSATFEKEGVKLGILGLNTAFLHLNDTDREGKLADQTRQFNQACPDGDGPEWADKHHACLVLTHHPLDWLDKSAQMEFSEQIHNQPERFALHLFGHMHKSDLTNVAKGGGAPRRHYQGCSLFSQETWRDPNGTQVHERQHGYAVGQLEIESPNNASLRFWPRLAKKKQDGSWAFSSDTDFTLGPNNAATPWQVIALPNRTVNAQLPPPAHPKHLILPPIDTAFFVGRTPQLQQLRVRLLDRQA